MEDKQVTFQKKKVEILDGGMGHQLARQKLTFNGVWGDVTAFKNFMHANIDFPDQVRLAHKAYIDAGAEVLTTNTFQCVPGGFIGCDDEYLKKMIQAGGQIAIDAKNEQPDRDVKVAGCVPPLGPCQVYFEYDEVKMRENYELIVDAINPYSDYFLCETLASIRDAKIATEVCSKYGKPIWLALNISDENMGQLASGESIKDCMEAVKGIPNLATVIFNCCQPESITYNLRDLKLLLEDTNIQIGGYGNGVDKPKTEKQMVRHYRRDLSPSDYYEDYVKVWIEECGATVVGGCCGIFPEHIKYIHDRVRGILKEAQKEGPGELV